VDPAAVNIAGPDTATLVTAGVAGVVTGGVGVVGVEVESPEHPAAPAASARAMNEGVRTDRANSMMALNRNFTELLQI